jgi:amino acid adenylation domain-containing protein
LAESDWEAGWDVLQVPAAQQAWMAQRNATPASPLPRLLFACAAQGKAQRTAVIGGDGRTLSYRDLQQGCDILAWHLCGLVPARASKLIAVLCEKGGVQVQAVLAVMRSGHGYLPLHVEWPLARIQQVLVSAKVHEVVVSRAQARNAALCSALRSFARLTVIEDVLQAGVQCPEKIKWPQVGLDDVAYVIFTSGSTGEPKGVAISHRSAFNTIAAVNERLQVGPDDKVLALSELSFDLSVYDIFGLLMAGGTVVFPEQARTKDMAHWADLVAHHRITLWNSVPQLAALWMEACQNHAISHASLRAFMLSGDSIPRALPDQLVASFPGSRVLALGGATEASIWSVWHDASALSAQDKSVPYGVAMPGQSLWVFNAKGQHCPVGVKGEIHIGGVGLALQYWGDKSKTEAAFYSHPVLGRLYKTGDWGAWSVNQSIEFMGRRDQQVKVRGYRVELGEIEACIAKFPEVQEVAVLSEDQNLISCVRIPSDPNTAAASYAFKQEQRGDRIFADGQASIALAGQGDMAQWARKSYRSFIGTAVQFESVQRALVLAPSAGRACVLNLQTLGESLHSLVGLSDPQGGLPKYRYPSAGSLYPVQLYVRVNQRGVLAGVAPGCYYHDRRAHRLVALSQVWERGLSAPGVELFLVSTPEAIVPLYGDASGALSELECGYIEGALVHALSPLQWVRAAADVDVDLQLAPGQQVLSRLVAAAAKPAHRHCYVHMRSERGTSWYACDDQGLHALSWPVLPEIDAVDTSAVLFNTSAMAVFFVSDGPTASRTDYLDAGSAAQQMMESLLAQQIGACAIGQVHAQHAPALQALFARRQVTHHFVAGSVSLAQLQEKSASGVALQHYAQQHFTAKLAQHLPAYMVPQKWVFLTQFPLSANGKLDRLQLRKLCAQQATGAPLVGQVPGTVVQKNLATLWAEILALPKDTLTVEADFFRLGGNSLLAMQLISRIQQKFGYSLRLDALYRASDMATVAQHIEAAQAETDTRITGEL